MDVIRTVNKTDKLTVLIVFINIINYVESILYEQTQF